MNERSTRDEAGAILFAFFLSLPMLLAFLAFGVDAVRVLSAKSIQGDVLQTAASIQKSPTTALLAKNSEDPGLQIAEATINSLRDLGYEGRIDVWFCERDEHAGSQGAKSRLLLFQTDIADSVETSFGALFGVQGALVESSEAGYLVPYSEFEAWKPSCIRNGRFRCEEGAPASQIEFTPFQVSEMPEEMTNQKTEKLEEN